YVSLELTAGPGGATLGGTVTVQAQGGVATYSGLSLSEGGSYTIEATSGGFTSPPITINVSGPTSSPPPKPPPGPSPSPTPTQVEHSPTPVKSRKGTTALSIDFNQPLDPASASDLGLYHVFKGTKQKRKTVYRRALKVRSVSYVSSSNS